MAETTAMQDALLAQFAAAATHATVFSTDPGRTGTAVGEVATARVAIAWSAPVSVGAAREIYATAIVNIPTAVTVNYAGVCSSSVVGAATVMDSVAVSTFTSIAPSTYTLTTITRSEP
jgi:hypothetical protein